MVLGIVVERGMVAYHALIHYLDSAEASCQNNEAAIWAAQHLHDFHESSHQGRISPGLQGIGLVACASSKGREFQFRVGTVSERAGKEGVRCCLL